MRINSWKLNFLENLGGKKVMPFLHGLKCFLMSYFQGLGENKRKLCSEEFSVPPTVSPVSQCMMGNNSGVASVAFAACIFLLLYARNNSESIMWFQSDIENILSLCHRCLHSSLFVPLFILSPLTNQQQDFTSIVHQKTHACMLPYISFTYSWLKRCKPSRDRKCGVRLVKVAKMTKEAN